MKGTKLDMAKRMIPQWHITSEKEICNSLSMTSEQYRKMFNKEQRDELAGMMNKEKGNKPAVNAWP